MRRYRHYRGLGMATSSKAKRFAIGAALGGAAAALATFAASKIIHKQLDVKYAGMENYPYTTAILIPTALGALAAGTVAVLPSTCS